MFQCLVAPATILLALVGVVRPTTTTTITTTPSLRSPSISRRLDSLTFEHWATLHQKTYQSAAELTTRRAVYENNLVEWDRLNQIPGGAYYGPEGEPHADLTPEEFVESMANCASGLKKESSDASFSVQQQRVRRQRETQPFQKKNNRTITINTIDWRNQDGKAYVTPPKSQGAHGTCWSFAAAENLEGLEVRQGFPLANISEQEFISCCPHCRGRSQEFTFEWLVNNTGGHPAFEKSYPYNGNDNVPCHAKDAPRAPVTLHSWGRIKDDGTGDPILQGLHQHGPMSLGVDAKCFFGYKGGIIRHCTSHGVNHAVVMVAAGMDIYNAGEPNAATVDYFTIKNSWGGKWGEAGYVRIEQGQNWWGPVDVIYTQ